MPASFLLAILRNPETSTSRNCVFATPQQFRLDPEDCYWTSRGGCEGSWDDVAQFLLRVDCQKQGCTILLSVCELRMECARVCTAAGTAKFPVRRKPYIKTEQKCSGFAACSPW